MLPAVAAARRSVSPGAPPGPRGAGPSVSRPGAARSAVGAADGAGYLALLRVGPDGTVRDAYHKRPLCGPEEQDLFAPGRGAAAIELDGWRLGLGVCYDGCFPEHARSAARAGAHA